MDASKNEREEEKKNEREDEKKKLPKGISWSAVPLLYFILIFKRDFRGFNRRKQGSGPYGGHSPVERGDFLSVCASGLTGWSSDLAGWASGLAG